MLKFPFFLILWIEKQQETILLLHTHLMFVFFKNNNYKKICIYNRLFLHLSPFFEEIYLVCRWSMMHNGLINLKRQTIKEKGCIR